MNDDLHIAFSHIEGSTKEDLHNEGRRILQLIDFAAADFTIAREENGRPYFSDHHSDFNISHSKNAAAVICSKKKHNGKLLRTSVDIQYVDFQKDRMGIALKAFYENEIAYIKNARTQDESIKRFYKIWVLKEVSAKLKDGSVFDMKKLPCFINNKLQIELAPALVSAADPVIGEFTLRELKWECKNGIETYMFAAALERWQQ
ncbi:MAG: hypothetical protein Ta2B_24370 [Termitinemataceae bacterium]|nr:MAG: hypothetical protein Ta2B_24370 [Termitinemataceae bacterium]